MLLVDEAHGPVRGEYQCLAAVTHLSHVFHSRRLATGSTPVVGSSRKMIEGSPTSAIPVLTLRLLPPLNITIIRLQFTRILDVQRTYDDLI